MNMSMSNIGRRSWILLAVFLVAVIADVGGYAYWTTTGTGSGSATTGTTIGITVNQTSVNTALYPGASSALSGDFTNTNTSAVYVAAVTASVTAFSAQANVAKPACTQADFTITGTATVGASVPVGTGGAWSGLSLAMTNSATNQDNCKSITVPITLASS